MRAVFVRNRALRIYSSMDGDMVSGWKGLEAGGEGYDKCMAWERECYVHENRACSRGSGVSFLPQLH